MNKNLSETIVLMGCKSCGKSTHGFEIAKYYDVPFYDIDDVISQMSGMFPRNLYTKKGEGAFMMAEEAACQKVLDENKDKAIVISTGGGICDNPPALTVLRGNSCRFVFLNVEVKNSIERIMSKVTTNEFGILQNLPAYIAKKEPKNAAEAEKFLTERFEDRNRKYASIADVIVRLKKASKEENLKFILEAL